MKPNRLAALLLGGVLAGGAGLAWAQTITLTPSLAVSEEYDDNILLSSTDRQSDFVTSVSPGLRLVIKDSPWDVTLAGSARGVYYASRSELNSSTDYQNGSLAVKFQPTPRFTASLTDTFDRSLNSAEVDTETGIITGRFSSYRNIVTPAVSYKVNPLTLIGLQYSFDILRSDSPLTQDRDTHEAVLSVQREITPRTSATLRYTFSRFQIEGSPDRDAHSPRVGLTHALSPTIRLSADAGVLLLESPDGSTEVTPSGMLRYEQDFSQGRFSLAYDRSARVAGLTSVTGVSQGLRAILTFTPARRVTLGLESGVSETDSVGTAEELRQGFIRATASFTAARDLTLQLDSEVRATDSIGRVEDFLVYAAGIRLDYRVLRWLSVNAGYRHTRQDDKTGPLDLDRNVVFLGFTASTDVRVY
ncbi:MAG: outer membrane beta-barrel protein [Candidatus Methylomirabilis sp.]